MATLNQKKAVSKISEKVGRGEKVVFGEIMKESGYSDVSAKTPKTLTKTKGYQEELAKYGLTEELVSCALVEDIKDKKGKRAPELRLASEVLGMNKKDIEKPQNITINFIKYG